MVVSDRQSSLDPMVQLRVLPVSLRVVAVRELFRALAAGHSLLAYPERGISPDCTVGEFKDGAFIIAIASQVVPAAIDGTCRIWPPAERRSTAARSASWPGARCRPAASLVATWPDCGIKLGM